MNSVAVLLTSSYVIVRTLSVRYIVLNLCSQSSLWSHAASTVKSLTGSLFPGGAASALVSATTSEVMLVRFEMVAVFASYATKLSLPLPGIDSEGHAANFVETEQIVQYNGGKASFVQVSLWNVSIQISVFMLLCGSIYWGNTFFTFLPIWELSSRLSDGSTGKSTSFCQ